MTPADLLRIGFPERAAALTALGHHFVIGRISLNEYSERCDTISVATTRGDLDSALKDLDLCSQPDLRRVSNSDRQAAQDLLSQQFVDGRLTIDEFSERSAGVAAALIATDLDPIFADLPVVLHLTQ